MTNIIYKFVFENLRVPSINLCYRVARGRIYKRSQASTFTEDVRLLLNEQIKQNYPEFKILSGDIEVDLKFYFRGKRALDCDNGLKIILDTFNKELYFDDRQVVRITAEKYINQGFDKFEFSVWKKY